MTERDDMMLPPGWEAVRSHTDNKIYYWNKKTGNTTWNFPKEEAQEHTKMMRRHTYENVCRSPSSLTAIKPTTPPLQLVKPVSSGVVSKSKSNLQSGVGKNYSLSRITSSSPSNEPNKRDYENVVVGRLLPLPQYEEIEDQRASPSSPRVPSHTNTTGNEVLSLTPPIPDRKYEESDVSSHHSDRLSSASPSLTSGEAISSEAISSRPTDSLPHSQTPPSENVPACADSLQNGVSLHHEISAMGREYAIVDRSHRGRKVVDIQNGAEGAQLSAPTRPLRAHERMTGEEEQVVSKGGKTSKQEGDKTQNASIGNYAELDITTGNPPSPNSQIATAYSVVKLDPASGRIDVEDAPMPTSPQPYEVVSPTPLISPCEMETPNRETGLDPYYEEIEREDEEESGDGYMKLNDSRLTPLRSRGFSSPLPLESANRKDVSELSQDPASPFTSPLTSPLCRDSTSGYDLPSNSRKLQEMNVTLRRSAHQQQPLLIDSGNYSRLSTSKEALLLRSGVTLRRNYRESLSSMSSYTSRAEGEENSQQEGDSGGTVTGESTDGGRISDEDDPLEPIDKCLGSNLIGSENSESSEDFKMIRPPSSSPYWVNYKRRPHAYEDIMGASQDMDWDESDMGQNPSPTDGEGPWVCELIKMSEPPPERLKMQKARVVRHQYEDVELDQDPKEGERLPKIPGQDGQSPSSPTSSTTLPVQTCPAQYLGWLPVAEDQLVTGECVKAVHSCIAKMAEIKEGKLVYLQVKGMELLWRDPKKSSPIAIQPINRIRVWGIGLENERDFGYVSRDSTTRKHQCHIFRCAMPARVVARMLLESHQKARRRKSSAITTAKIGSTSNREPVGHDATPLTGIVGGHEQYERIPCVYIGSCDVPRGLGMDVLNEAVEQLAKEPEEWTDVIVDVAISSVTIHDHKSGQVLKEHRIRYLCFLGIARNDKFCGYILETGERRGEKCFRFYGFRMEPNTDRLCLALHLACQARYRRVLESRSMQNKLTTGEKFHTKSTSSSSLLGMFGSLKKSKKRLVEEETRNFVVQYLGYQCVDRVDGLETVRPVVQELAANGSSTTVNFDVSPAGLSIMSKMHARREFPVKSITYVVKIRNYFAFVTRESGKYQCYVFMESKVDAGTIVTTIQQMLVPDSA